MKMAVATKSIERTAFGSRSGETANCVLTMRDTHARVSIIPI